MGTAIDGRSEATRITPDPGRSPVYVHEVPHSGGRRVALKDLRDLPVEELSELVDGLTKLAPMFEIPGRLPAGLRESYVHDLRRTGVLAQELVELPSLWDLAKRASCPVPAAIEIARVVCTDLANLEAQGIRVVRVRPWDVRLHRGVVYYTGLCASGPAGLAIDRDARAHRWLLGHPWGTPGRDSCLAVGRLLQMLTFGSSDRSPQLEQLIDELLRGEPGSAGAARKRIHAVFGADRTGSPRRWERAAEHAPLWGNSAVRSIANAAGIGPPKPEVVKSPSRRPPLPRPAFTAGQPAGRSLPTPPSLLLRIRAKGPLPPRLARGRRGWMPTVAPEREVADAWTRRERVGGRFRWLFDQWSTEKKIA